MLPQQWQYLCGLQPDLPPLPCRCKSNPSKPGVIKNWSQTKAWPFAWQFITGSWSFHSWSMYHIMSLSRLVQRIARYSELFIHREYFEAGPDKLMQQACLCHFCSSQSGQSVSPFLMSSSRHARGSRSRSACVLETMTTSLSLPAVWTRMLLVYEELQPYCSPSSMSSLAGGWSGDKPKGCYINIVVRGISSENLVCRFARLQRESWAWAKPKETVSQVTSNGICLAWCWHLLWGSDSRWCGGHTEQQCKFGPLVFCVLAPSELLDLCRPRHPQPLKTIWQTDRAYVTMIPGFRCILKFGIVASIAGVICWCRCLPLEGVRACLESPLWQPTLMPLMADVPVVCGFGWVEFCPWFRVTSAICKMIAWRTTKCHVAWASLVPNVCQWSHRRTALVSDLQAALGVRLARWFPNQNDFRAILQDCRFRASVLTNLCRHVVGAVGAVRHPGRGYNCEGSQLSWFCGLPQPIVEMHGFLKLRILKSEPVWSNSKPWPWLHVLCIKQAKLWVLQPYLSTVLPISRKRSIIMYHQPSTPAPGAGWCNCAPAPFVLTVSPCWFVQKLVASPL